MFALNKYIELEQIGTLYIEKTILSFDVPVLFVCRDMDKVPYFCMNIDSETGRTVIAKTSNGAILDMLKNKVTIESVFRNTEDGRLVIAEYDTENCNIISHIEVAKEVSEDILPTKRAFSNIQMRISRSIFLTWDYCNNSKDTAIKIIAVSFY